MVAVGDLIAAAAAGLRKDRQSSQSTEPGNPFEELTNLILGEKDDALLDQLETEFQSSKMFEYVRALVTGIQQLLESEEHEKRVTLLRFKLVEKVVQLLGAHRLQNQTATKVTSSLVGLVEQLQVEEQVELCELIRLNFKQDPACFQGCLFLPPLLSAILHQGGNVFSDESEITPAEFRSRYFESLFSLDWDPSVAIPFCEMFRDLSLNEKELKTAIEKLSEVWDGLPPQEIPAAVQNLLLLSTKGCKALILHQIVGFFEQKSAASTRNDRESVEMRQIEGTAALQINFAVKQDQNIGKQYLTFLKKNPPPLSPFLLGLLLSLARISCFHQLAFDIMKTSLSNTSSISGRTSGSPWLTEFVQPVEIVSPESNRAMIRKIIAGSTSGWDHILPSIIELGVSLLESNFSRPDVTKSVLELGRFILFQTFRSHQHVQSEILSQIASRVLTNADYVERHLSLLQQMVREVPQDVRSHRVQVKEAFDYLTQLPQKTAISLIHSILPLVCIDSEFQNYVILVLRKAMFNAQIGARLSATEGFLSILEELCKLESPTNSLSQSSTQHPPSHDKTFIEILGILRRSTTQQTEIRTHLYRRMPDLCKDLPQSLYPPFFSILFTQLGKYYVEGEGALNVYLALDGSRSVRQVEPLGDLLGCIGQCVSMVQPDGAEEMADSEVSPIHVKLERIVQSLLDYLLETEPETLKNPPCSASSMSDEAEKLYRAEASKFLRDVYVAAIECSILFHPDEDETIERVLQLFSHYQTLSTGHSISPLPGVSQASTSSVSSTSSSSTSSSSSSSSSSTQKKRGRSKTQPPPPFGTTLSIPVIEHLLQVFPEKMGEMVQVNPTQSGKGSASQKQDGKGSEKPPVMRRKHQDFLRFVISNCYHHDLFSKKEGTGLAQEEVSLEVLGSICEFLVSEFRENWKLTKSTAKESSVPCFCLETFLMILENTRHRGGGVFCLLQVWDTKKKTLSDLMPCVLASLAHVCKEKYVRESQVLLRLLNFILDEMSFSEVKEYALDSKSSPHYSHLLSFQLSTAIVRPYARFLSRLAPYSYDLMDRIVSSVAGALGSIYEDQEEHVSQFKLIDEEGGAHFVSMIVDSLDSMLDEAEFSVGFFLDKGGLMEKQQKVLCDRLLTIQSLLSQLTTCGASGPRADGILRILAKFYRVQSKIMRKFLSFDPESVSSAVTTVIKHSLALKGEANNFIKFLDTNEGTNAISNIKKESQLKPQLTFMLEQYQAIVLKLAKRTKLKLKLPRTHARDFKMSRRKVGGDEIEEEGGEEGSEEEDSGPQKKRRKVV